MSKIPSHTEPLLTVWEDRYQGSAGGNERVEFQGVYELPLKDGGCATVRVIVYLDRYHSSQSYAYLDLLGGDGWHQRFLTYHWSHWAKLVNGDAEATATLLSRAKMVL